MIHLQSNKDADQQSVECIIADTCIYTQEECSGSLVVLDSGSKSL